MREASPQALLLRLLLFTPVLVALVEEVAFRGLLLGRLRRTWPGRVWPALVLSSAAFALWHVTVNLLTLGDQRHQRRPGPFPSGRAGGCWASSSPGWCSGPLSLHTGGLGAPWLAHWLVDALMLLALAATGVSGGAAG